MTSHEQVPLLASQSDATPVATPASSLALPVPSATVSSRDLNSFPCLSPSTTEKLIDAIQNTWATIKRTFPFAQPFFIHCEDYELAGAAFIGTLVFLFVLTGYFLIFPAMQSGYLRAILKLLFSIQVIAGYSALYLFRNTNPGYIPVNEGALDAETSAMLSQPMYAQTTMVLTRPFEPVYTPEELEQQRLKNEADEAQGIYDHYNIYGVTQPQLEQEFCRTCRIWRPPRSAHCYQCQQCVLRMDHHCALLGNCVGVKNHRFFLLFIFLVGSGALTLAASCACCFIEQVFTLGFTAGATWLSLLLLIPLSLASGVLFIFYFHLWLLMTDVTLREKYGRKRTQREVQTRKRRDNLVEIWHELLLSDFQWKSGSIGLRNRQLARKEAADPYRAAKVANSDNNNSSAVLSQQPVSVVVVVPPGEEQIGCNGPVSQASLLQQTSLQSANTGKVE